MSQLKDKLNNLDLNKKDIETILLEASQEDKEILLAASDDNVSQEIDTILEKLNQNRKKFSPSFNKAPHSLKEQEDDPLVLLDPTSNFPPKPVSLPKKPQNDASNLDLSKGKVKGIEDLVPINTHTTLISAPVGNLELEIPDEENVTSQRITSLSINEDINSLNDLSLSLDTKHSMSLDLEDDYSKNSPLTFQQNETDKNLDTNNVLDPFETKPDVNSRYTNAILETRTIENFQPSKKDFNKEEEEENNNRHIKTLLSILALVVVIGIAGALYIFYPESDSSSPTQAPPKTPPLKLPSLQRITYQNAAQQANAIIPLNKGITLPNNFTIEGWIKASNISQNNFSCLQIKSKKSPIIDLNIAKNNNYFGFKAEQFSSKYYKKKSFDKKKNKEQWFHIALCYRGKTLTMFINGNLRLTQENVTFKNKLIEELIIGSNAANKILLDEFMLSSFAKYRTDFIPNRICNITEKTLLYIPFEQNKDKMIISYNHKKEAVGHSKKNSTTYVNISDDNNDLKLGLQKLNEQKNQVQK